ncbi:MAG TPA: 30S ribosome-binding factor RbfA [Desulfotignum sp.]|nr:30S ribosome-binding factor RbfA [Desulfotignum sp.]
MKPYTRAERISIKIQQAITELLTKKISDPRIEMATISRVKMTADLRLASVYVTVFGDADKIAATLAGFKHSRGFIKKHIAPELGLKYMPELRFFHDDSFDKAAKMDALIASAVKDLPRDQEAE